MKNESSFVPTKGGNGFAIDLIKQIDEMNRGQYLYEETLNSPSNFCIGAAGYPEKHFEAMNLNSDLKNLKLKVDAGAEFIVTQLFYDNNKYFEFVDKCREIGIKVNQIGTQWAIEQSKELIKAGVPVLHFYTMGKGEAVKNIASKIF